MLKSPRTCFVILSALWTFGFAAWSSGVWVVSLSAAEAVDASGAQVLEWSGVVEISRATSNTWVRTTTGDHLHLGDRLRTGAGSRASLQWSAKSVIRIQELSLVEIHRPQADGAQSRFKLLKGSLFFLNREKPGNVEFETPLATGAIQGTEFLLEVSETDGSTRVALLDGKVALKSGNESRLLVAGEQALIRPQQSIQISPALPLRHLIQWCFYYPGILNPSELPFASEEQATLKASLSAYSEGDMAQAKALEEQPALQGTAPSEARAVYAAFLKLATGHTESTNSTFDTRQELQPFLNAYRGVVAGVNGDAWSPQRPPMLSTEWMAASYFEQSHGHLLQALHAAQEAVRIAPQFGFAWARLAELEFGLEHREAALRALERAKQLSPRHAQVLVVEGFVELERLHAQRAAEIFNQAIALDGTLGSAWLGRALAHEQLGNSETAQQDLQAAAALEPQRSLYRSYLAKAWSQGGLPELAEKDFSQAKALDPLDPTPWYYRAWHGFQNHRINTAIRELETAESLNDNRSIFRSRLQLDRDQSMRGADLAALYDAAGLPEPGDRSATRAVGDDERNFAGHLFKARTLLGQSSPRRFDLRSEAVSHSELLRANLLAPAGGENLSQVLSQQDSWRDFKAHSLGFASLTEYASRGDWIQAASIFGRVGRLSYALDEQYLALHGDRINNGLERKSFSLQARQSLGDKDSLYVQVGSSRTESGDVSSLYDPTTAKATLQARDVQEPSVVVGWHREWAPESHTLLLLSRHPDRFHLLDPQPNVLFLQQSGGHVVGVQPDPFFSLDLASRFQLFAADFQQIWENEKHRMIAGARAQWADVNTEAILSRGPSGVVVDQEGGAEFARISPYVYYGWHPIDRLRITAGITYDWMRIPRNLDLPPLVLGHDHRSQLSPKLGLLFTPWEGGAFRGAWTRSLGGLYFDSSIRLEPTQVEGFTQAYRSLIPESSIGLLPGAEFDTWNLSFDQRTHRGLYFGMGGELLQSRGGRDTGAFSNSGLAPVPDTPTSAHERFRFEEKSVSIYARQLLHEAWSLGTQYRLSHATLQSDFPDLPATILGISALTQEQRSLLGQLRLQVLFNHPCGFFAQWNSDFYHQSNAGYTPDRPGDRFWQHDVHIGYRFPKRHAEFRIGLLNLADQDYRLNPLNVHSDIARGRTWVTSLRLNF